MSHTENNDDVLKPIDEQDMNHHKQPKLTYFGNYNAHISGLYPPFDYELEEEFDAVRSIN